ncbi:MAG: 23S rRNA (guanosine-2'-O-)-methyltransferase RlmB [Legionellaceae bacterium]
MNKPSSTEIIFGIHSVLSVISQMPERILSLYLLQGREDKRIQEILEKAQEFGLSIQTISRQELDKLTLEQNHQGILAKCRPLTQYTEADIDSLLEKLTLPPLILILDGIQDPHNLGACLRTADAAGVNLVLAPKDHSVGLTPIVRKIACGAAENIPFIQVANLARTIRKLKEAGIWIFGAMVDEKSNSLYESRLKGSLALVLGSEGKGLRRLTMELCDELFYIPMLGTVESLNVSVATGVTLFEALRQRKYK